jgi:tRNA threonylcarbamoyl adenosine modification protein (Sua5/YciO/YrdC/YwlC family)
MTKIVDLHPTHPQHRLVVQVAQAIRAGGVIAYPTDSCYALACALDDRRGPDRIRRLRELRRAHHFSLMCAGLSEVSQFARVDNQAFRWLKQCLPGPYTFIMRATGDVPKRVQHARRRTVGIRVPEHPVTRALLDELGAPLMSSTLQLPGDDAPLGDPREIHARLSGQIDLIAAAGESAAGPSTVVDLTSGEPELVRVGTGDPGIFE